MSLLTAVVTKFQARRTLTGHIALTSPLQDSTSITILCNVKEAEDLYQQLEVVLYHEHDKEKAYVK